MAKPPFFQGGQIRIAYLRPAMRRRNAPDTSGLLQRRKEQLNLTLQSTIF